jgi:hypothetical protein
MNAQEIVNDVRTWMGGLDPKFTFLVILPFVVGAAGLLGDWYRNRRARKGHVADR